MAPPTPVPSVSMTAAIVNVIGPAAMAERERVIKREFSLITQFKDASGVSATPSIAPANVRTIWMFDGEQTFMDAILDTVVDNPFESFPNLDVIKLAAAASNAQQPCDVTKSFIVLKQLSSQVTRDGDAFFTSSHKLSPASTLSKSSMARLSRHTCGSFPIFRLSSALPFVPDSSKRGGRSLVSSP